MPNFYEMFETPKIHWPITFVVDTSGSMAGQRLIQLNSALQELSNILESLAYQGDIQLSIRLIEFNTTARWVLGDAEKCEDHLDVHFSEASGLTNTGEALRLARSAMNRTCKSEAIVKPGRDSGREQQCKIAWHYIGRKGLIPICSHRLGWSRPWYGCHFFHRLHLYEAVNARFQKLWTCFRFDRISFRKRAQNQTSIVSA